MPTQQVPHKTGLPIAIAAFMIWGLFPLYFKQLHAYAAVEIIAHRIVWTLVCTFILLAMQKNWHWLTLIKQQPKWLAYTFVSSWLIALNWLTYVWAVNHNQILAASLGYFIGPLVGIGMGLLVFKEKLRRLQMVAIGFATISVLIQLILLGQLPWVALVVAFSFIIYGTMHKKSPIHALPAMFIETLLLTPFALAWLFGHDYASSQIDFWHSSELGVLILAGPVTLLPLLLYNHATKKVAFSLLSFAGYITPSMIFLLAIFYYHEPFDQQTLIFFALIWIGLALYSYDLWQHRPKKAIVQDRLPN